MLGGWLHLIRVAVFGSAISPRPDVRTHSRSAAADCPWRTTIQLLVFARSRCCDNSSNKPEVEIRLLASGMAIPHVRRPIRVWARCLNKRRRRMRHMTATSCIDAAGGPPARQMLSRSLFVMTMILSLSHADGLHVLRGSEGSSKYADSGPDLVYIYRCSTIVTARVCRCNLPGPVSRDPSRSTSIEAARRSRLAQEPNCYGPGR